MKNTYWNKNGPLQKQYDVLAKQIPATGECPPEKPALELLRKAANAYYDLFNNGLCNRRDEFSEVFRFDAFGAFGKSTDGDVEIDFGKIENSDRIELAMTEIIISAALEHIITQ